MSASLTVPVAVGVGVSRSCAAVSVLQQIASPAVEIVKGTSYPSPSTIKVTFSNEASRITCTVNYLGRIDVVVTDTATLPTLMKTLLQKIIETLARSLDRQPEAVPPSNPDHYIWA